LQINFNKYEDTEKIKKWLTENDLDENLNAEEALNEYIEDYEL